MTANALLSAIDSVLKPLGFKRNKWTWNRETAGIVDVVTLQRSKYDDEVTVTLGVLNSAVFRDCWGEDPQLPADETACTVRTRLGEWIEGRERWWNLAEEDTPSNIAGRLAQEGVPFLDRMHSLAEMEQYLVDTKVLERSYPLPIIYLAILKARRGQPDAACSILMTLGLRVPGAWKRRVSEASMRLGCRHAPA